MMDILLYGRILNELIKLQLNHNNNRYKIDKTERHVQ